jgi:hypothetical protein
MSDKKSLLGEPLQDVHITEEHDFPRERVNSIEYQPPKTVILHSIPQNDSQVLPKGQEAVLLPIPTVQNVSPQHGGKSIKPSLLEPASEEQVNETIVLIKTKIFSEHKKRVVYDVCSKYSVTCQQARLFLDCFRISFEKKEVIRAYIHLNDPENIKTMLDTFDFNEDKAQIYQSMIQ